MGQENETNSIMSSIKANRVVLLVIVLFISAIFFVMIRYFLMAIFLAAIFSALAMPLYNRMLVWVGGRKSLSAGITMLTIFIMGFLPLVLLLGIVAIQAVEISRQAAPWIRQILEPAFLGQQLQSLPFYPEMVVYREDIMQRVSEVASKTGSVLFNTLFSFTYSAVNELFLFFIFLYTVFFSFVTAVRSWKPYCTICHCRTPTSSVCSTSFSPSHELQSKEP